MKKISHIDANIALSIILLLMISLLAMNIGYVEYKALQGNPLLVFILWLFAGMAKRSNSLKASGLFMRHSWWTHILLIFIFANILPYSKHFHVFMSVPNVFLSRLDPWENFQIWTVLPGR